MDWTSCFWQPEHETAHPTYEEMDPREQQISAMQRRPGQARREKWTCFYQTQKVIYSGLQKLSPGKGQIYVGQ